jgi:acyl dehydratase
MGAFIRGEGGFGDSRGPELPTRVKAPEKAPDEEVTYATRSDQALLYRLSGDRNPLHSDPAFAALAGFPKPILHGLCTYGVTGRALLHTFCGSDPSRFRGMDARFSKPVMPGDVLTVRMWRDGDGSAIFQTVTQDGTVVIDNGKLTYA